MRSLWCTLIAVCFVAAGVRPHHAERTRGDAIHVATAKVASARRVAPSGPGPLVAPAPLRLTPPRLRVLDITAPAPSAPLPRLASSPRSSRGPPHA